MRTRLLSLNFLIRALGFTGAGATVSIGIVAADERLLRAFPRGCFSAGVSTFFCHRTLACLKQIKAAGGFEVGSVSNECS
jgi:hypothetical protein